MTRPDFLCRFVGVRVFSEDLCRRQKHRPNRQVRPDIIRQPQGYAEHKSVSLPGTPGRRSLQKSFVTDIKIRSEATRNFTLHISNF